MKFGRRLLAEAARSKHLGQAAYLDYKALKKALKADIAAGGKADEELRAAKIQRRTRTPAALPRVR